MKSYPFIWVFAVLFIQACGSSKETTSERPENDNIQTREEQKELEKEIKNLKEPEQTDFSPEGYIEAYKQLAIIEMKRSGVPASITLAQGMLESSYGKSYLARKGRNHFGIKCKSKWDGRAVYLDDDAEDECFRAYSSVLDSYKDHSDFLANGYRYQFLFELDHTDYKGWAHGLRKAGYATNPKYGHLLIKIIERYDLNQYDRFYKKPYIASVHDKKAEDDSKPGQKELKNEPESQKPSASGSSESRNRLISHNGIPAIKVKVGERIRPLAKRLDMMPWQLEKYNELREGQSLSEGAILYLKPKRGKPEVDKHEVKKGQTLQFISQKYGVKEKKLRKWNLLEENEEPLAGEYILLNSKRDRKPQVKTLNNYANVMLYGAEKVDNKVSDDGKKQQEKASEKEEEIPLVSNSAAVNPYKKDEKEVSQLEKKPSKKTELKKTEVKTPNYPTGQHTVEAGETLFSIARNYNMKMTELKEINGITGFDIDIGQVLKVKKQANGTSEKRLTKKPENKASSTNIRQHTVEPGESLYAIARKYDCSTQDLVKSNKLESYNLQPGQQLIIPEQKAKPEQVIEYHEVEPGDTLYRIAKKYELSVEELKKMNQIGASDLSVGQRLRIRP